FSCVLRRRLKSMMLCASDWYFVARPSSVSVALTVTTIPGTGGIQIWSPVATTSLEIRLVFDQRIWLTVTWYLAAMTFRFSPAATVYMNGSWLIGADSGIATGLMIVV